MSQLAHEDSTLCIPRIILACTMNACKIHMNHNIITRSLAAFKSCETVIDIMVCLMFYLLGSISTGRHGRRVRARKEAVALTRTTCVW